MPKTNPEDREEAVTSHDVDSDSLWQTHNTDVILLPPLNQICFNPAFIWGLTCGTLQTLDGAEGGVEARGAVITPSPLDVGFLARATLGIWGTNKGQPL